MFCKSCGKEIPENAKFCSGCGAPVSRPEQPPEAPAVPVQPPAAEEPVNAGAESAPGDDLTAALETSVVVAPPPEMQPVPAAQPFQPGGGAAPGKQKKMNIALILAGAAAAAVVAVILLVILVPWGGGREVFLYRTEDDELMFRKDLKAKTEPVELTDDEPASVRLTQDGKYVYFLEGTSGDTADLYRIETAKIGKKGVSPEKVSSDVNRYSVKLLPSGGAVYVRGGSSGQLRCYDGKESYKLASDVDGYSYSVDEKGTYAYYTESDSSNNYARTLYRVRLKPDGEKEKLLKDADMIYSSYDAAVLVYGKSNGYGEYGGETYDIYSQVPGGEKTKLISDVSEVLDVTVDGTKVSLVYLTAETERHTLYDFVSDASAGSDAQEKEPEYDDYKTLNQWGWVTTDWDAYNEAYEKWYEVSARNYLRQTLQETEYNVTTYSLGRYENGQEVTLAADLAFYPTCSAADGIYLYARSDQEISAVCDVQDLEYWEEIYEKMYTAEQVWYQNVGGVESPLEVDEDSSLGGLYVLNGDEAVLEVYEDGEALLQAFSVGKSGLSFASTITDEEHAGLSVGKSGGKDALYYFTDLDRDGGAGELMCYTGGRETSIAKDAGRVVILDDGRAVFKLEDVAYNERRETTECSLYVVKDGKSERIADDVYVYGLAYLDAKRVVYISDGDLCVWNGKDSERIASDVENFWTNAQADRQTFSCS